MKISISHTILFALFSGICAVSCRTEFEKIRTSNEPEKILTEAHQYYEAKEYTKAQALYELSIPVYRGRVEAEDIFYNYAYAHFYNKQYILAAHYFNNFANTFVYSPRREEADFMSAYSNFMMSPTFKLDQTYTYKAIDGFQLFINTYPQSDRVPECNELIDEMRQKLEIKAYEEGRLYYNLGHFTSAVQSFENMLKDFPETERAENIRYLIAKSSYVLAQKSIYNLKEERYSQTIDKCNAFLRRFPASEYSGEINKFIIESKSEIAKLNS